MTRGVENPLAELCRLLTRRATPTARSRRGAAANRPSSTSSRCRTAPSRGNIRDAIGLLSYEYPGASKVGRSTRRRSVLSRGGVVPGPVVVGAGSGRAIVAALRSVAQDRGATVSAAAGVIARRRSVIGGERRRAVVSGRRIVYARRWRDKPDAGP
jgi:hypothetical protein